MFLCSSAVRKFHLHTSPEVYDDLDDLMNNEIREKLGIIPDDVIWGGECLQHRAKTANVVKYLK